MTTWLTIPQAVNRLAQSGVQRHPATIRRWIRDGQLPALRPPGTHTWYMTETALMNAERNAYLNQQATRQPATLDALTCVCTS